MDVRAQARAAYELFSRDPFHRSLHFKCVDEVEDVWSVRIGRDYRALGRRRAEQPEDAIVWFWIGPHADYDRKLRHR